MEEGREGMEGGGEGEEEEEEERLLWQINNNTMLYNDQFCHGDSH